MGIFSQRRDLTGQRFGKLFVQSFSHVDSNKKPRWNCLCDCGNVKVMPSQPLTSGNYTSCGCQKKEILERVNTSRIMDMTGWKSGFLTYIREAGRRPSGARYVVAHCAVCNKESEICANSMLFFRTRSCCGTLTKRGNMNSARMLYPEGMYFCSACNQMLPVDSFYKNTNGKPYGECKPCTSLRAKTFVLKKGNPERNLLFNSHPWQHVLSGTQLPTRCQGSFSSRSTHANPSVPPYPCPQAVAG